jgi:hypothetical protein
MVRPSRVKPKGRRVFVSYARKDGSAAAQQLCQELKSWGCDVWIDVERIRGGDLLIEQIENAVGSCDVLLALLTPESEESEICRCEQVTRSLMRCSNAQNSGALCERLNARSLHVVGNRNQNVSSILHSVGRPLRHQTRPVSNTLQ